MRVRLILAAALLSACLPAWAQTRTFNVRVTEHCYATPREVRPAGGAVVTFTSPSASYPSVTRTTDADGRASIELGEGIYELFVKPASGVATLEDLKVRRTDLNKDLTLGANDRGTMELALKYFGSDLEMALVDRRCSARDSTPPPPPIQEKACGTALQNEYASVKGLDQSLAAQLAQLQATDAFAGGGAAVASSVRELGRVATDAARAAGTGLENALLKPLVDEVRRAAQSGGGRSLKDEIEALAEAGKFGQAAELGARALDLVGVKEQVDALRRQAQAAQQQWAQQFQEWGRVATDVIGPTIPLDAAAAIAQLRQQREQVAERLSKTVALAEETRCKLSEPPPLPAGAPVPVVLGLAGPGATSAISGNEAAALIQLGSNLSFFSNWAAAQQRLPAGGRPLTAAELQDRLRSARTYVDETARLLADRDLSAFLLENDTIVSNTIPTSRSAPARRLAVATGEAVVVPAGTGFLVHRDAARQWTFVSVSSGSVTVLPATGQALTLDAGQSALIQPSGATSLQTGPPTARPPSLPPPIVGTANCLPTESAFGRSYHLQRAQSQPAEAVRNDLRRMIDTAFRCQQVSDAQAFGLFGRISVLVARSGAPLGCFRNDAGVLDPNESGHRGWASQRGRDAARENAQWKTDAALACLAPSAQQNLYADIAATLSGTP